MYVTVPYNTSDLDLVSTPQLFHTFLYNQARRLRLEKLVFVERSIRYIRVKLLNYGG